MNKPTLDQTDLKILVALQSDGRSTIEKLAKRINLSARACLERVRRLEKGGIILGYQAVIDLARLSKPINVFAEIIMDKHAQQGQFERRICTVDEVVECWEVTGTVDYMARFVCPDLARYQALTTALIDEAELGIARIVSHIVLRPIRRFEGYPESLLAPKAAR